jgi:hypothetical protein
MWEPNFSVRIDVETRRIQQSVFVIVLRMLQAIYNGLLNIRQNYGLFYWIRTVGQFLCHLFTNNISVKHKNVLTTPIKIHTSAAQ